MSAIQIPRSEPEPGSLATESGRVALGWSPVLALLVALGVLVASFGDLISRQGSASGEVFFWAGLVIAVLPIAARVAWPGVSFAESLALVASLAVGLYLFKLGHSPTGFTFHDEFLHWRTAYDLQSTGREFTPNPLLPVSSLYPGIETVTVAFAELSGLSLFVSGVVVVGAARLLLSVALFLLYWEVGRSVRLAGVASVVYMANPNFLFFSAEFSYESLALPLALIAFLAVARRSSHASRATGPWTLVMILIMAGLVVTHHLTTFIFAGFLLAWTVVYVWWRRRPDLVDSGPRLSGPLLLAAGVTWVVLVAPITLHYLEPHVHSVLLEIGSTVSTHSTGREPFQGTSGAVAPLWQRVAGALTALILTAAIPFGLWTVWHRARRHTLALTFALIALLYPVSLALRFTTSGWEIANRSSEFVFLGLGFTVAAATLGIWLPRWLAGGRPLLFALVASLIVIGGVVSGWPRTWLMPGPYLPSAGPRSIEPEGVSDALQTRVMLGPHRRFGADRVNDLLLGSYGVQDAESTLSGGVDTSWIFLSPIIGPQEKKLIRQGKIRYILTDERLTSGKPAEPQYDGTSWRRPLYYARPIPRRFLTKFDHLAHVGRIFDSGHIHIYDVSVYNRRSAPAQARNLRVSAGESLRLEKAPGKQAE